MSQNYNKLFSLDGKKIIVTGGAGILGSHLVKGLLDFGGHVAVIDRDEQANKKLAESLPEYSENLKTYCTDLTSEDSIVSTLDQIQTDFGPTHVLVNNAAGKTKEIREFFEPAEEFKLSNWKDIMSVNCDGMFLMARHVGKRMIQAGVKGSIIQTASIYGVMAPDQRIYEGSDYLGGPINSPAVYTASKAAVVGLTKYFASYWGDQGIRVNSLIPGGIESGQNETFTQKYSERVPLGRMAQASEMVGAVVYLASDASSYVTGTHLHVDGGLSCW